MSDFFKMCNIFTILTLKTKNKSAISNTTHSSAHGPLMCHLCVVVLCDTVGLGEEGRVCSASSSKGLGLRGAHMVA